MTGTQHPWFINADEVPVRSSTISVCTERVGDLEIRSGRMRVSSRHGLTRGSTPLDAELKTGTWQVTRFIEGPEDRQFPDGDLAAAITFGSHDLATLEWTRATRDGIPTHAATIVGEADLGLLLGDSPYAACYPMVFGPSRPPTPEEEEAHRRHDRPERGLGRLLPTSDLNALVLRPAVDFPWWLKDTGSPIWLGRTTAGDVAAVVVDHLTGFVEADEAPVVESVWNDDLPGAAGGQMELDVALPRDSANLNLLPDLPHVEEVRLWHECDLRGRLLAVDAQPGWLAHHQDAEVGRNMVHLGISVNGTGRFYALKTRDELMTILRVANEPPASWARLPVQDGRHTVLISDTLVDRTDMLTKNAFGEISQVNATGLIDGFPAFALWPTTDGGRPTVWMVGFTEAGKVAALLIADDLEGSVFACRPPEEDGPALQALRKARVSEADQEEFADAMDELERAMHGREFAPDPETRGFLHWLFGRYVLDT